MTVNINAMCSIVLTEIGAILYRQHHLSDSGIPFMEDYRARIRKVKTGDVIELQLWEIMTIFGQYTHNGMEAPFVKNEITIEDDNS